jgi:hypothetical protein
VSNVATWKKLLARLEALEAEIAAKQIEASQIRAAFSIAEQQLPAEWRAAPPQAIPAMPAVHVVQVTEGNGTPRALSAKLGVEFRSVGGITRAIRGAITRLGGSADEILVSSTQVGPGGRVTRLRLVL